VFELITPVFFVNQKKNWGKEKLKRKEERREKIN
jgi:hypothetical protein